jgi:hypothetical protein
MRRIRSELRRALQRRNRDIGGAASSRPIGHLNQPAGKLRVRARCGSRTVPDCAVKIRRKRLSQSTMRVPEFLRSRRAMHRRPNERVPEAETVYAKCPKPRAHRFKPILICRRAIKKSRSGVQLSQFPIVKGREQKKCPRLAAQRVESRRESPLKSRRERERVHRQNRIVAESTDREGKFDQRKRIARSLVENPPLHVRKELVGMKVKQCTCGVVAQTGEPELRQTSVVEPARHSVAH